MSCMNTCIEIKANDDWVEYEFEVEFSAAPIVPAKTYGLPENCYPAEGGEVEISNITCTETPKAFTAAEFVLLKNWALIIDGRKPSYLLSDLEDACREACADDDYGYEPSYDREDDFARED